MTSECMCKRKFPTNKMVKILKRLKWKEEEKTFDVI